MTQTSIANIFKPGDSISLAKLENAPFTIVEVVDSNYEDHGKIQQGVKITTKDSYDIEGKKWNKFHSTRITIVNKLRDAKIRKVLSKGDTIGPVKAVEVPAKKGGKSYFDLVPA